MRKVKKAHRGVSRGFTLIELLVVTSLISLLSSIVLDSVTVVRNKGRDASIRASLDQARSQLEIGVEGSGLYGEPYFDALCPTASNPPDPIFYTDTTLRLIIARLNAANNGLTTCAAGTIGGGLATSWAMSSALSTGDWWCVDSIGAAKITKRQGGTHMALSFFVPTVSALMEGPPGPYLGGGDGEPAVCP